jgi:Ca2+-binding RTX toxin-like protein
MATFIGTIFDDEYFGNKANQYGIDGDDVLSPKSDSKPYFLYGGNGEDTLVAYSFNDELYGGAGDDFQQGYDGDDYLDGGSGGDVLFGQYGNDYLSGGLGQDSFVFDSVLNKKLNFDFISDFVHGSGGDLMQLDNTVFKGVGQAQDFLKSSKFHVGTEADTSKVRIVYNQDKGVVSYDPDGSGPQQQTKFVKVDKGMKLSADDFFVIEA